MFRALGRLFSGFIVFGIILGIGVGSCTANFPDENGRRPNGTYVEGATPAAETQTAKRFDIGDAVIVNPKNSKLQAWISDFSPSKYPDYYRVVGSCSSAFASEPDGIRYGGVDEQGHAVGAAGWITGAMRAERRGTNCDEASGAEDPAGWPSENPKVTIAGTQGRRDYRGYLWNRTQLIPWSLGGDTDARNLIAGTRTQSVGDGDTPGGMAYPEALACAWLDEHPDGRLWYAVKPIYPTSAAKIPVASMVDIYAEDGSIDQKVLVFNGANGLDIDYETGFVARAATTRRS